MFAPTGILINNSNSLDHFVNLKKEISNQINDGGLDEGTIELKLNNNFMQRSKIELNRTSGEVGNYDASNVTFTLDSNQDDVNNLREQMDNLKRINKQLYQYQLQKVYRS